MLLRAAACIAILSAAAGCAVDVRSAIGLDTADPEAVRAGRAVHADPGNAHAWLVLGRSEMDRSRTGSARRAFEGALKANPDLIEARVGIGLTYLQDEEWKKASRAFGEALEMNARSLGALEGKAAATLEMGRVEEAEALCRRILEVRPQSAQALRLLGEAAYMRRDYDAALSYWKSSVAAGENDGELQPVMRDLEEYVDRYGDRP